MSALAARVGHNVKGEQGRFNVLIGVAGVLCACGPRRFLARDGAMGLAGFLPGSARCLLEGAYLKPALSN